MAVILASALSASAQTSTPAQPAPEHVRDVLTRRANDVIGTGKIVLQTSDGWFFFAPEMLSYGRGPFWGENARSDGDPQVNHDPLKAIVATQQALAKVGVTLLVVPIPGKTAIYVDKIDPALGGDARWDEPQKQFLEALGKQGVDVVDLVPEFRAMRKEGGEVFRPQDSHPTPAAYVRAAKLIGEHVRKQPWFAAGTIDTSSARKVEATMKLPGDLAVLSGDESVKPQDMHFVQTWDGSAVVNEDRSSPIIVIGDSNVLHCHPPAGLVDHLFAEIGRVDLVGVNGEGINAPRITLARRRDNFAGKKCVIWCFATFVETESPEGWRMFPMTRAATTRRS